MKHRTVTAERMADDYSYPYREVRQALRASGARCAEIRRGITRIFRLHGIQTRVTFTASDVAISVTSPMKG